LSVNPGVGPSSKVSATSLSFRLRNISGVKSNPGQTICRAIKPIIVVNTVEIRMEIVSPKLLKRKTLNVIIAKNPRVNTTAEIFLNLLITVLNCSGG